MLDYSIDPQHLELTEPAVGSRRAELEISQAVYDAQGNRVNRSDAGLEVDLDTEKLAR